MRAAARSLTKSALSCNATVRCVTISPSFYTRPSSAKSPQQALFHTSAPLRQEQSPTAAQLKKLWNIAVESVSSTESTQGIPPSTTAASKMSNPKPNSEPPKHEMAYFKGLASTTRAFGEFRRVMFTGLYSQVVVMEVPVGGEIGDEVHTVDQILIITSGKGLATIAGKDQPIAAGDVIVVPAGTQHQFITQGDQPLELITVYSPAEHLPTTVHKDKEIGDKEEDEGIDEAPEWSQKSKKENEKAGLVREDGKYD